jgi:hypothetical protein
VSPDRNVPVRVTESVTITPEVDKELAGGVLDAEALGVGEDHKKLDGRKFVLELINNGKVKMLFLEHPRSCQTYFDVALKGEKSGEYEIKVKAAFTGGDPEFAMNPVYLGDLAVAAEKKGIPVFLADIDCSVGSDKRGMIRRDNKVAELFREKTEQSGKAGCLILFGSEQFKKGPHGKFALSRLLELKYVIV